MPTSLLDLDTWRAGTMMSVTTCQYPSIYLSIYLSVYLSIYHHLLAPDYDVHNYMSISIYLSTYLSTHLSIYHHLLAPWGDIINVREKKGCPCHLTPVCWTKDSILHIEAERSILKDRRRAGWGRMEKGEWNRKKKGRIIGEWEK